MIDISIFTNLWQFIVDESQKSYFSSLLNLINVLLIFLTAFVTYLSWKTAKNASEAQLLPLLAIYFRGNTLKGTQVLLKNIGLTPAYDIQLDSYTYILTDIQNVWKLEMKVPDTNVVISNEEKILKINATNNDKKSDVGDFMIFHLDPREEHPRQSVALYLTFKNLQGKKFYSKITTGQSGLFVGPAYSLNLLGSMRLRLSKFQNEAILKYYKFLWKFREPYFAQPKKPKK